MAGRAGSLISYVIGWVDEIDKKSTRKIVKINEDEFWGEKGGRLGAMKHVSYIRLGG